MTQKTNLPHWVVIIYPIHVRVKFYTLKSQWVPVMLIRIQFHMYRFMSRHIMRFLMICRKNSNCLVTKFFNIELFLWITDHDCVQAKFFLWLAIPRCWSYRNVLWRIYRLRTDIVLLCCDDLDEKWIKYMKKSI